MVYKKGEKERIKHAEFHRNLVGRIGLSNAKYPCLLFIAAAVQSHRFID